ncbi:MAG: FMN-binding protein [Frankiales bacterium]|nr:FMN-binding protein [Frankiales bacterium]
MVSNRLRARRNVVVVSLRGIGLGLLRLFPTSTNRQSTTRRPGEALASPGVVASTPGIPAPSPAASVIVVNGTAVDTRYGLVQVQISVRGSTIVAARAIDYPQGSGRDREINTRAVPVLQQETLAAQSSRVDAVSGATYTSQGYRESLQAALDAAHLG